MEYTDKDLDMDIDIEDLPKELNIRCMPYANKTAILKWFCEKVSSYPKLPFNQHDQT